MLIQIHIYKYKYTYTNTITQMQMLVRHILVSCLGDCKKGIYCSKSDSVPDLALDWDPASVHQIFFSGTVATLEKTGWWYSCHFGTVGTVINAIERCSRPAEVTGHTALNLITLRDAA